MIIDVTEDEHGTLVSAIVFLIVHHQEGLREAEDSARRFPRERKNCLRVAEHHQEQIYQAGELAAKLGARNGWPRPTVAV